MHILHYCCCNISAITVTRYFHIIVTSTCSVADSVYVQYHYQYYYYQIHFIVDSGNVEL